MNMTPEEMQSVIEKLVEQVQELQQTVDDLSYSNSTHVHSGNDGTAKLRFINLTDTPSKYNGTAGYFVKVNSDETGLTLSP